MSVDVQCRYSVIVPTLNEAAEIGACVARLRALGPQWQVIVADGGSRDGTPQLAAAAGAAVVTAPRGRGPQLAAGAAVAAAEILVFLHADTQLPTDVTALLTQAFADPRLQVAKFRLSFDQADPLLRLAARMMWVDSLLTSYGDQGIVMRRSLYQQLGGFREYPLFEDVDLFARARRLSRVRVLPARVITSARRFRRHGTLRQLLFDVLLWLQYLAGVSPHAIARRYERGGADQRG
jgi:rSAM/selenodomain-associated transferase 2